jgi:hypothetical protein
MCDPNHPQAARLGLPVLGLVECSEHPNANQPPSVGSSVGRPQLAPRLGPFLSPTQRNHFTGPTKRPKAGYEATVLAFEASGTRQVQQLCRESWLLMIFQI